MSGIKKGIDALADWVEKNEYSIKKCATEKRILHLHLKFKWFDQLPPKGSKRYEYRLANEYWSKRLQRDYDEVWFYRGYQKAVDGKTLYKRKFVKPSIVEVVSEEWNNEPQICYAIPTYIELDNKK